MASSTQTASAAGRRYAPGAPNIDPAPENRMSETCPADFGGPLIHRPSAADSLDRWQSRPQVPPGSRPAGPTRKVASLAWPQNRLAASENVTAVCFPDLL